jgi:hypothetical protein
MFFFVVFYPADPELLTDCCAGWFVSAITLLLTEPETPDARSDPFVVCE